MTVPPPSLPPDHPDRDLTCEEAMEAQFQALCEAAESAGWAVYEIDGAIVGLQEARLEQRAANAETERQISEARRSVSH